MWSLYFFKVVAVAALALSVHTSRSPLGQAPSIGIDEDANYEYVIVGSGPGGSVLAARLALAGRRVLLLEAGGDHGSDVEIQAPNLFPLAAEDEKISWNYYVNHYKDTVRQARDDKMVWETRNGTKFVGQTQPPNSEPLGILYPRTGALGGCANHNAMITIYPFESDWDHIANITEDKSWSSQQMRKYFERMERNTYLPQSTSGHGFDGWLDTKLPNFDLLFSDTNIITMAIGALKALGQAAGKQLVTVADVVGALHPDLNNDRPDRDSAQNMAFRAVESVSGITRSSPRDFVLSVANMRNADGSRKYKLDIQLHTLVTKVRFAQNDSQQPRAVGVDYVQGLSLYAADPRADLTQDQGIPGTVNASREVILAAGAFNTPQLLKLSGIGPETELSKLGIPMVHELAGVGANMQDRYEIALISETAHSSSVYRDCTHLEGDDPCAEAWRRGSQDSPYASSGSTVVVPRRSSMADNSDNDIITMSQPGYFNGYFPGFSKFQPNVNMTYETWVLLKAHSRNNAGTVTLRSTNPRDVPLITFNSFDTGVTSDGADNKDVTAVVELLEFGRQILGNQSEIDGAPHFTEITPGPSVSTRAAMEQYVKDNAWGHHASCTAPIGHDGDPMAVLDSRFRVRGIAGLRVVDASIFPKIPSTFIVVPIYMISEKAADVILEDME